MSQNDGGLCHLTVKLRGRPEAPAKRRGRILSSRARGADTQAVHGPLQRLLEVLSNTDTVENASPQAATGSKTSSRTLPVAPTIGAGAPLTLATFAAAAMTRGHSVVGLAYGLVRGRTVSARPVHRSINARHRGALILGGL